MAHLKIESIDPDGLSENRSVLLRCRNGNARLTVEVSQQQITEMVGMIDTDRMSQAFTDQLRTILAERLRKGWMARKLWPTTIDHLKAGYAAFFGMHWDEIIKRSKFGTEVERRSHVYLSLNSKGYEYGDIALYFASRDRSTVFEALNVAKDRHKLEEGYRFKQGLLDAHMAEWMMDQDVPNG